MENKDILINANLHLETAKKLIEALEKGLDTSVYYDNDTRHLAEKLKQNIYAFSAAKSFTQMMYYRDMMIGDDGNTLSKGSFIKKIANTGEVFNKRYLEVEYENAYYSSIMADQWDRYAPDDLLEYTTVGDRHVRPAHAALDKHTAPKNDPFWIRNYPPNGWNCRCSVVPGDENFKNKLTDRDAGNVLKQEIKNTPFDNNVGLSKLIFKDNHPYFVNSKGKESNLSWEQYGMRDIDRIRTNQLPEYIATTMEDYLKWWEKQKKINGDDIAIKDVLGNNIILESHQDKKGRNTDYFKEHIIRKEEDKRHEYATEVANVLKNPDEVWMNPKDNNTKVYLKYYENGTIKLIVNGDNKGETMFLIEKGDKSELNKLGEARKGILLHR
ncbi:phage putative head morphogenesis protein, SPP1 gp7 family [Chryseobacterium ureilyticum]|uniref:Phage putative head morphogenesis protein, SPP1 gp7 family n=1 Tax=Chryseobacterium ureilyticum TaxID=373668 RepID=A0A1N7QRR9_9FLAO|nr:phage minor head protein [Chryseobacterium ureilyticum]SIT25573.1 phage putative head morphogenesis protein, SPP1 gp7 family [Chryseobacterium ureilyticum]